MYDDDDELEVVSETRDEQMAGEGQIIEFEEVRGLASPDEIAASLDEAKHVIDVEDSFDLFSSDEEEEEEDEDVLTLDADEFVVRISDIVSEAFYQTPLSRVGQALVRLTRSGRSEKERAALETEIVRVISPWAQEPSYLSPTDMQLSYMAAGQDLTELTESWSDIWDSAFARTLEIEQEQPRIEALRALTGAFEIWSCDPTRLGSWKVLSLHKPLRREIGVILTEIDSIESGLWRARGLEALASLTKTILKNPNLAFRMSNADRVFREFDLENVRQELREVSGDENKVSAIHNLNLRTAELLDVTHSRLLLEDSLPASLIRLAGDGGLLSDSDIVPPKRVGPPTPRRSGPRYADYIFYHDKNHAPGEKVPDDQPLQVSTWYHLEVAVRVMPIGIHFVSSTRVPERRTILEPSQQEPVTIWVTVEPDSPFDPNIEIEAPVKTLLLPPEGDSSNNAFFRVRSHKPSTGPTDLSRFRVCLYYEFNLLETDLIQAEVVPAYLDPPLSQFELPYSLSFMQLALPREYVDFDHLVPRSMQVNIRRREGQYVLGLLFTNATDAKVKFFITTKLTEDDLSTELFNIRKQWYEIALGGAFQKEVVDDEEEFIKSVRRLAEAGRRLWNILFLSVSQAGNSAAYNAWQWLTTHPVESGGMIQISFETGADNFVFPWSLVYDKEIPNNQHVAPDPQGFWGIRYCIEQQIADKSYPLDKPTEVADNLKLGFMIWNNFRNMADQKKLMEDLASRSSGKLTVSNPPISNPEVCYEFLKNGLSHILYFYTHGHTRVRPSEIGAGYNFQVFTEFYEGLAKNDKRRTSLLQIYQSFKKKDFEPDRSWIELTDGKLYLDEMVTIPRFQSKPVVILNMCESAQITPSFSQGFVDFFLDRGADSVIGTECPMTIEFAHPFSVKFLTEIMTGASVGIALLNTRRHFMSSNNPLGLAYTLFGSATVSFKPPMFS